MKIFIHYCDDTSTDFLSNVFRRAA